MKTPWIAVLCGGLWLVGCEPSSPPTNTFGDLSALDLRLRARTAAVAQYKTRVLSATSFDRRALNRGLDSLEEFRTVAAVKLDTLRAADEDHRAQARDDADAALNDLDAAFQETQKRFPAP